MSKGTTIISDLRSFFSESENNRAINAIMRVMECINIRPDQIGTEKKENCKFTNVQVLNLLVLFPFFVVRNAYQYSGSSLSRLFCCEKDMFYRFMNDGNIKWRKLLYAMNLQLRRKISRSTEAEHDKPVCLIIDDTDAPKSGRKSELIDKVFSHILHKTILGYKCMTLLYTDGLSHLFLDFSLHGEEGRNPDKKQGLTNKQRSERFSADYTGQSVEERIKEYTVSKIDKAIEMVKYAINRGIRFDYLLVDSWFTCADFVKLITSLHIKCHLIGMIKLGIPHHVIPLDFMSTYFRSSLLSGADDIPEGHYADENMKSTVVPFRNGIMLAIATGMAETNDLSYVMMANHGGDHTIYPDCRPEFVEAFDAAAHAGTFNGVHLLSPYCHMTKSQIAARGLELGINYAETWSCHKGGDKHCGRCGTCIERKEALAEAGIPDPTDYLD